MRWGLAIILAMGLGKAAAQNDPYTAAPARFTVEDLAQIVNSKNPPRTIEQALDRVGEKSPRIYENFVLMYRSKSLQTSSFMHPRAIVYNTDASFLMTFNGHESQRGFKRLEMIHFKFVEKKWELLELVEVDGKLNLSDPNPRACLNCHQSPNRTVADPRPNWEPYSRWAGAYGSEGSLFNVYAGRGVYRKEDEIHIAEASRERVMLSAFLTWVQPGHPRYGRLKIPEVDRLMDKATDLTDMLAKLNFHRVMRLAQSDAPEHFPKIRNLLAGAMRCGKFYAEEADIRFWETQTPDSREEFVTEPGFMMKARRKTPDEFYSLDGAEPAKIVVNPEKYPDITVSEALYLLFQPFGIDISDWSMDFRTNGRLAFRERFGTPSNPQVQTSQAFRAVYPEYKDMTCDEIASRAVPEAAGLRSLPVKPPAPSKPLIGRCISCHAGREIGVPQIPFDKPELLKSKLGLPATNGRVLIDEIRYRLSDHATDEERMPMGPHKPSLRERAALVEYLERL